MGDREKKSDKTNFQPAGERKRFFGGWIAPGSLTPIPVQDPDHSYRRSLTPAGSSRWQRFRAWLHYYSIQYRWDIERCLARLLRRRWGDQL